jgi:hypothetical protein
MCNRNHCLPDMPILIYACVLLFCLPAAAQLKGDVYNYNVTTQRIIHFPYRYQKTDFSCRDNSMINQRYISHTGDTISFLRMNDTLFRFIKMAAGGNAFKEGFYTLLLTDPNQSVVYIPDWEADSTGQKLRDSIMLEGYKMAKTGYWTEKDSVGNRASGHYTNDCRSGLWTFVEYPYSDCYNETFSVRQVDYGQPGAADIKKAKALLRGDADTLRGKWYYTGSIADSVWYLSRQPVGNAADSIVFMHHGALYSFAHKEKRYEVPYSARYYFNSVSFHACHRMFRFIIEKADGDSLVLRTYEWPFYFDE